MNGVSVGIGLNFLALKIWLSFKVAQEALVGDKYVTLRLLTMFVHQIREAIILFQGATCDVTQPQLKLLVDQLKDFKVRWVEQDRYWLQVTRGDRGCQKVE